MLYQLSYTPTERGCGAIRDSVLRGKRQHRRPHHLFNQPTGNTYPYMKTVRAQWSTTILVCRKCSRKLDGGFGNKGRQSLTKALRATIPCSKGRKAPFGILEVRCQDICPKNAVVVIDTAQPSEWLIVPRGADITALSHLLGLGGPRHPTSAAARKRIARPD